jgi:hypothetical protein
MLVVERRTVRAAILLVSFSKALFIFKLSAFCTAPEKTEILYRPCGLIRPHQSQSTGMTSLNAANISSYLLQSILPHHSELVVTLLAEFLA